MNVPTAPTGTNAPQIEIVPTVETEIRLGAETTEIKNGIVIVPIVETDTPITTKEEVVNLATTKIRTRIWNDNVINNLSMIKIREIWTENENKINNDKFLIDQIQINHLIDPHHLTQSN
jgi:hypothetical protein